MLNQEQLAFLAEILPCWKAMDREHQRLLERTMTERSVKRGEYLYQGDRDCTGVFWLRYGQGKSVFNLRNGKADHPLPALGAGQLLSVRILRHQKYQF
ncbi:MAG: hypothetical protein ACLVHV_02780 [Oscillospiraceae bacterium]